MEPSKPGRLDSWKEIAAYLKRDVTTVRRWERLEGLPVHRHMHGKLGSVYAFTAEIDAWVVKRRSATLSPAPVPPLVKPVAVPAPPSSPRPWLLAAILLFVLLATIATLGPLLWRDRSSREFRFPMLSNDEIVVASLTVSPDGQQIAFGGARPGQVEQLWLRPLNVVTPQAVAGTAGARFPFWSPNSRQVGFFAGDQLKKLDLESGLVSIICDGAGAGRGATWSADDDIVFSRGPGVPLRRVPAGGGSASPITALTNGDKAHSWPEFLPDREHVLYVVDHPDAARAGVYVTTLSGGEPKRVLNVGSNAIYTGADGGYLLYILDHRLMAQRFDLDKLETIGEAVPVAEPVFQQYQLARKGDFSASRTGRVVAYRLGSQRASPLVWRDRDGGELSTVGPAGVYGAPILSPAGTPKVAAVRFDLGARSAAIWITDLTTGGSQQFTYGEGMSVAPLWSPDAERMLFASIPGPVVKDLRVKPVGGAGPETIALADAKGVILPEQWTPDGQFILYNAWTRATKYDIWALRLYDSRRFPLLRSVKSEGQAQVCRNGRFISYTSDKSGRPEVYVATFPDMHGNWRVSSDGGGDARWRGDCSELFYIALNGDLMAVPIDTALGFEAGTPKARFNTRLNDVWTDMRNHYDVSADGQRFIFVSPVEDLRAAPYTVVANWRAK